MFRLEGLFLWLSMAFYVVSFASGLYIFVFRKRYNFDITLFRISTLFHLITFILRWINTGHMPVMGGYEHSLIGSWFLSGIFIFAQWRYPVMRRLHLVITALVILILGNGIQTGTEYIPLEPPYRSNWLYVHVFFAWLTFGSYFVAASTGLVTITREFLIKRFSFNIPEEKFLDELSLRLILFGFFSETIMIGSGAIWAHGLWGRYWGWDPVETWSLISWLLYGLNLHLRLTYGWRGKRAAYLAVISLVSVIALFFGIGYISGLHTRML